MNFLAIAYGLKFDSELPLPEFSQPTDTDFLQLPTDVTIRLGNVPNSLDNPTGEGVLYQASANCFLFKVDDVAKYLVKNGNEINIEPEAGSSENDIRVFMLGSVMGALLHQRHYLVLHAGVAKTKFGAVLFAGPSGSGKSTLLCEMMQRGYPMMVDDVCAITLNEQQKPVVIPGYARTRLWADSANELDISTAGLQRTRETLEKFECQRFDQFYDEPAPLYKIYSIEVENKDQITLNTLSTFEKFKVISRNTYRAGFMFGLQTRQSHFQLVQSAVDNSSVINVTRPSASFKLKELADKIEENINSGG